MQARFEAGLATGDPTRDPRRLLIAFRLSFFSALTEAYKPDSKLALLRGILPSTTTTSLRPIHGVLLVRLSLFAYRFSALTEAYKPDSKLVLLRGILPSHYDYGGSCSKITRACYERAMSELVSAT